MVKNDRKKQLIPGGIQWLLLRTIQTWRWQSKGLGDRRDDAREEAIEHDELTQPAQGSMDDFIGKNPQGNWRLRIQDYVGQGTQAGERLYRASESWPWIHGLLQGGGGTAP